MDDLMAIKLMLDAPCACTNEQQFGDDPTLCPRCTAGQEYEKLVDDIRATKRSLELQRVQEKVKINDLDNDVGRKVMGWTRRVWSDETDGGESWYNEKNVTVAPWSTDVRFRWSPSTNIQHAFQVMHARSGWRWGITENYRTHSVMCWLTGEKGENAI